MSLFNVVMRGAREHNLTGSNVTLPRDSLIGITGLSGWGKSRLLEPLECQLSGRVRTGRIRTRNLDS